MEVGWGQLFGSHRGPGSNKAMKSWQWPARKAAQRTAGGRQSTRRDAQVYSNDTGDSHSLPPAWWHSKLR
eukprot:4136819-Prymnesium_polylepis.1